MTVLIGHASISEKGTINGTKGDQTGREVCTRAWYSKPWDYMAVHPDAEVREKHAKAIEAACANNKIGYGQVDRNTANAEAKKVNYDISSIKTKCNTDCSALQNLAAVAAGTPGVLYGSNGWTTATMESALKAAGYKIIKNKQFLKSSEYCVRGAIYVKSGSHTVCGLTNAKKYEETLKEAGISANGIPAGSGHIQLDYKPGKIYKICATGLRIRTKKSSQLPEVLPSGKIIGTVVNGKKVKNQATARVGNQIWMYIGLDKYGQEQWICADTGEKAYIK